MKGKLLIFSLYGAGLAAVLTIGWTTVLSLREEEGEAPTATSSPTLVPAAPLPPLPSAHPALTAPLTTLAGEPLTLQRWGRGTAVVLLWASWCAMCEAWLEDLARLSEAEVGTRAAFVAVNRAEAPEDVRRQKERLGGNLHYLLDPSDTLFGVLQGEGMPLLLVLQEGEEVARFSGQAAFPREELRRLLLGRANEDNSRSKDAPPLERSQAGDQ